jgi:hypothetical protein
MTDVVTGLSWPYAYSGFQHVCGDMWPTCFVVGVGVLQVAGCPICVLQTEVVQIVILQAAVVQVAVLKVNVI